jgi:S-layer family protein
MLRASVATLAAVLAGSSVMAQAPAGPEFMVNSHTTGSQAGSSIAIDRDGEFIITWTSSSQDGSGSGVYGRRYAENGAPIGGEFVVPTVTTGNQSDASIASGLAGSSVIVWEGSGSAPDVRARRYGRGGAPRGNEFVVNSSTTGPQVSPRVAALAGGGFAVAWQRQSPTSAVVTRGFDAFGMPKGGEVVYTPGGPTGNGRPAIAAGDNGRFVIVWETIASGNAHMISARLFDADGTPFGPPFGVSETFGSGGSQPDAAMARDGSFVVVWVRFNSSPLDIVGRRVSPDGVPIGGEFVVDQGTTSGIDPKVASDEAGNFMVSWSGFGAADEVMARWFAADGTPRSGDFVVNAYTTGLQRLSDVASDDVGNFVVSWTGPDGSGAYDTFARRFGGVRPASLAVDPSSSQQSDGNGVLEPGEAVTVRPSWRNVSTAVVGISGTIPSFAGPTGAAYGIVDDFALYGVLAPNAAVTCSDCFSLSVSAPNPRPAAHWDAVAKEEIAPAAQGQRKLWTIHVGNSFSDVPRTSPFYRSVETLLHHSVTSGCGGALFCPQAPTTREQMAVFVVSARDAAGDPPPACGTPVFADVPASSPFCRWIEELARSGVVSGCGGGSYCPSAPVSREQMAVFVLRTFDATLQPPACTTPVFGDVPASSPFCPWIEELARRGVVSGCGGGNFCPQAAVTREQMAVFIGGTFGLTLYGP